MSDMFGMSRYELDEMWKEYRDEPTMLVMSILSDAQHVLEYDKGEGPEKARQYMNRAKYFLSKIKDAKYPRINTGDTVVWYDGLRRNIGIVTGTTYDSAANRVKMSVLLGNDVILVQETELTKI